MPYTDRQGRVRPITPRKLGVGGLVVTLGLGVTIAFSSTSGLGGAGSVAGAPVLGVNTSVGIRSARTAKQKGDRTRLRLSTRGADATGRVQDDGDDCASLAYGQVRAFLSEHPCRTLQRGSFSVSSNGGDRVVVAVAWIEMPDAEQAADLKALVDTPGTGSIRPLDPRIVLSGQHYASRREGELVSVAEAEPDDHSVRGRVLDEVAREAAS